MPATIVLLACGDATTTEDKDLTDGLSDNIGEVEIEDGALADPIDIDAEAMQIDDYVKLHLDAEIAASSEDLDYENGQMYYYSILDVKGGYAKVEGMMEGWYEFALWRMASGSDLVGVTSAACGPICDYSYDFYEHKEGAKEKVTADVIPWEAVDRHKDEIWTKVTEKYKEMDYPDDCQLWFNLPQSGTSMIVDISVGSNEYEHSLLKLSWDKSKFSVAEYYKEIK